MTKLDGTRIKRINKNKTMYPDMAACDTVCVISINIKRNKNTLNINLL